MYKAGSLILFFLCCFGATKAANCEVTRYSTTIDIVNNRIIQTDTVIIRILNRAGEDYAHVSINYSRNNPITNLKAWIVDNNGKIVRYLKDKEITESNTVSTSFYTDYFTKNFTLKHDEYPYHIAYTYQTSKKHYVSITHWQPVFGLDVPVLFASLTFNQPKEIKASIIQDHIKTPEIITKSGVTTKRWTTSYDGTIRKEVFSPDPWGYLPVVHIIPDEFIYGMPGSMSSWQSFGNWQSRLNKGLDELPESEKSIVRSKIFNTTDKREIVKILYYYLQDNTSYINVQIGIGGLKPYPASYVAHNKFGDCKALSIYMKALLKCAGIESYYLLVNSGESPGKFYPGTPFQQFNHAMLAVPLEKDTIWLENTSNCMPFGYYGIYTQNRKALLIDGDKSRLVNIPPLESDKVANSRKLIFKIEETGGTRVSATLTYRGAEFEAINNLVMNFSKDDQSEIIHNLLPFQAFDLYDWEFFKDSRDAEYMTLSVSAEINQIVNPIGDQYYFLLQRAPIPDLEAPQVRNLPVMLPYPIEIYDTLTYMLPTGKIFTEIPEDKFIESRYGKYDVKFSINDKNLIIYRHFKLNPLSINPDEYPEFYNFIASIKNIEKIKILFQQP